MRSKLHDRNHVPEIITVQVFQDVENQLLFLLNEYTGLGLGIVTESALSSP